MTFTAKAWQNGNILDSLSLIDLETRLSAYSDYNESFVNVKRYGATGDSRQVADANITTGTNILTSATAVFTSADIGKNITVKNGLSATNSLVTTVQSVTNSTTAVLASSSTNTVSATYAVIGTKNDTQFNNALVGAGSNKTVYVPPGTYMFSSLSGSGFRFSVANQTIILARGATLISDGSYVVPFRVIADGVTICGEGTIDGNLAAMSDPFNPAGTVLNATSRNGFTMFDATVQNGGVYGIAFNNSSKVEIRRVKVYNIVACGICSLPNTPASHDIVVEGCYIDNSMVVAASVPAGIVGIGISIGANPPNTSSNVRVINNTVICPAGTTPTLSINSQGIIVVGSNAVVANNTVTGSSIAYSLFGTGLACTGNIAVAPAQYGIELPGAISVACTGNTVDGGGIANSGIFVDASGGNHITIAGNTVYNMPTTAAVSGPFGISVGHNNGINVSIVGNNITVAASQAIYIENTGSGKVLVVGNMCVNTGSAISGIQSQGCNDILISNNQMTGGFTNPIYLSETSAATRNRLIVIGNSSDSVTTVVKQSLLTLGTGCNIHSNGGDLTSNGGISTSTPGAVTTVNMAHGLTGTPTKFQVQSGDANSRAAPAYYVTVTTTNIVLNFVSALTAATAYTWNWRAEL